MNNRECHNQEKIAVIGPVLPCRGGIAQHTTLLSRALSKLVSVQIYSFKRQYPAWLFPGESELDSHYLGHREENAEYRIDSLNPFSWLSVIKKIKTEQVSMVLIPWWTFFWAFCFGFISASLRRGKCEIVFFCHNVVEHESAWWKSALTRFVLRNGKRFVVHTREDECNLRALLGKVPVCVQPHPIYDQFPDSKGILSRRKQVELLFYGFVRPYKGLGVLLDAMSLLKGKDIQLTVAGEFWEDKEKTLQKILDLGLEQQVEVCPRYHTDEETAELFARADAVVLPYLSATGSGVVPIAYHYNKPVVVTRVGGLPDVVRDGETGFIVPPGNPEKLAEVLANLSAEKCLEMADEICAFKTTMSWDGLAKKVLDTDSYTVSELA